MSAISIKNLSKSFRIKEGFRKFSTKFVLKFISLNVKENEIFGLIGLNGIGKTTLIKSILEIINFDSGEIEVFGVNIKNKNYKKEIYYLPEKFFPSQHLTGYDFLKLSALLSNETFDKKKAILYAEKIDFDPKNLTLKVGNMSKGMGQKIGLISAFLSNAKLLILDEPMSGLDPKARIAVKKAILEAKNNGKTIFFSSHILHDVQELSDNVCVIHDGEVKYNGNVMNFIKEKNNFEESFLDLIS